MTIGPPDDANGPPNYDDMFLSILKQIREMAKRSRGHKALRVSTTEIVQEIYLRMRSSVGERKLDRIHFLSIASLAIRTFLADVARRKSAEKRGGQVLFVTLQDGAALPYPIEKQLDVDRALKRLYDEQPELAAFIDARFYGGCTDAELTDLFELSPATAQRRIRAALAWMKVTLSGKLNKDEL